MHRSLLPILFAVILGAGCELFGPDDASRSAVGLDPGTRLTYRATFVVVDAAGNEEELAREEFRLEVSRERDAIGSYTNLLRVRAFPALADTVVTDVWYQETDDQVVEVAYRNVDATPAVTPKHTGSVPPASSFFHPYTFKAAGLLPLQAASDSLYVRDAARLVYQLPLIEGDRWITVRDPFIQAREVLDVDTLQVEAGVFPCTKIVTQVPVFLPGMAWLDCVADEGLILRIIQNESARPDGTRQRTLERIELVGRSD